MMQEKLAAIKADLEQELQAEKAVLAQLAEPELKKILTVLLKKGILPLAKAAVEESENKVDDIVWAAIDDKVEAVVVELIAHIKL